MTLGCGVALAAGLVTMRARADQWSKRTVLSINQPIQITDTVLQPGTYVLKLLDSSSDRHIVQIFNADESHIINTVLAIPNYRLQPTGKSQFTFWETPPGTASALRAWFYPGDNFGQEFRYPKHLMTLASYEPAPAPEPAAAPPPVPEPPAAAPEPETKTEEPVPAPAPEPQAAPEPAPAPEPQPAAPPESLPKTGSNYPMIGLGGFLSLGLYSLLRMKTRVS